MIEKWTVKDINTYRYFDYPEYYTTEPVFPAFRVGDVVYIKSTNSIGVVLGCIDAEYEDLRTDMDGMQAFSNLEFATTAHLNMNGVQIVNKLKLELLESMKSEVA